MSEPLISPKKYELVEDDFIELSEVELFRIRALVNFGNVKAGELGGYIEKEANLSQLGKAWVSGDAQVYDDARVSGNARISGHANISDRAKISGDARVTRNAWVTDDARVFGNAHVSGNAQISGEARVSGNAQVLGNAWVSHYVHLFGNAHISGDVWVFENAKIGGSAQVLGHAERIGISEDVHLSGSARVLSHRDFMTFGGHGPRTRVTVYRTQTGIELTHDGFCGTSESFLELITQRNGESRTTREYRVGIEYALSSLQPDDSLQEATA